MKLLLKLTIITMITLISGLISLFAQQNIPMPPLKVQANLQQMSSGSSVIITWIKNDEGVQPTVFNVYATFNDEEKLMMLGSVKNDQNSLEFKYMINNLHPGIYHFFVRSAIHLNGMVIESQNSEVVTLEIKKLDKIIAIVSKPVTEIKFGEKWFYQLEAVSSNDCKYAFELLHHPEGMTLNNDNSITWLPEKPGTYKVSIRAFYTDCKINAEDVQSFALTVTEGHNGQLFVKIHIEEAIYLKLGEVITHQLKAESNANCPIKFEVIGDVPEGFVFDGKWTFRYAPVKEGKYQVTFKATLECEPNISDTRLVTFVVGEGTKHDPDFCAWIKGNIQSEDGNAIPAGEVRAWKLDRQNKNDMPYFKSSIKEGSFTINVPEGNYALDFTGPHFYAEWYENAEFITDAQRITIACDETKELVALVKPLPVPKTYKVSGTVFDAATNTPIFAVVEFTPAESIFNDAKGSNMPHKFFAKTDDKGYYEIQLPDNYVYIANAISAMNSVKYNTLYWEKSSTPMEADLIELTADRSDINFGLSQYEEANLGFSGQVKTKDGLPLVAKVMAYCVKSTNQYFKEVNMVFTSKTDENGYYTFNNLIPGDYVVLSVPIMNKDYIPGYYKVNDYAVLKWKDATIIGVAEAMPAVMIDIIHQKRGELGAIRVGGKIINSGGVIGKSGDELQAGVPVGGAFVYAVDIDGNVSDYGYSNNDGDFTLSEATEGTLRLIADKVGFDSYEGTIETNYSDKANVQVELPMAQAVLDVKDDINNIFKAELYPVPANKNINVKFISEIQGKAEFSVINTSGDVIFSTINEITKGENVKSIELSSYSSGAYFLKISIGEKDQTVPFSITK